MVHFPLVYFASTEKAMAMVFCRGCAKEIHESAPVCPHCGCQQFDQRNTSTPVKSQNVTVVLAVLIGALGVHRFYLGKILTGVLYLLFCWTGIPALLAYIEAVVYTFTSQDSWARQHNNGVRTTPVHVALKVLALIFPAIMLIGILAAIAIPAYKNYVERTKYTAAHSEAIVESSSQRVPAALPAQTASLADGDTANANAMEIGGAANSQSNGELSFQASFDCARAASKLERLVCSTAESAQTDRKMAEAYTQALAQSDDKNLLITSQREWLAGLRRQCEDAACVTLANIKRTAALQKMRAEPGLTPESSSASGRTPATVNFASCQKPAYPKASARNEEEGTTTIVFLIGTNGAVMDSKISKSSGSRDLDRAAQEAISLCQFTPASINGEPQQAWVPLQYVWSLQQ
jgi:TonB family protein